MASELIPVPNDLGIEPTIRGLEIQQYVFGRYRLRRIVGRGGMGIVWLAQDERLDREVALKFLPDAINFDAAALDDLKRETRRCLELTHPNIIRIYDFVKDEQAAAISMEYIDGQTLANLRIEQPARVFEVNDLREGIAKACEALHYAHEEVGVVHRDLKPANFMVTSRGQMKVADFGIAQSVCESMTRLTVRRSSSGTLSYMSPQQLSGEVARPSDDIYALGATIYELLTGKPPFHSGDVSLQVRLSVPRSMAEKRRELEVSGDPIPREWEETIAACLAKIPEERPATMAELADRLRGSKPTVHFSTVSSQPATNSIPTIFSSLPGRAADLLSPVIRELPKPYLAGGAVLGAVAFLFVIGLVLHGHHDKKAAAEFKPSVPAPKAVIAAVPAARPVHSRKPVASVAPASTPPVAVPAEIRATTDPSGALVHIDGQADQYTPAIFKNVPPGNHQLTFTAAGYRASQQSVTVVVGAKIDIGSVKLERLSGNLNLSALPEHVHYVLTGLNELHNVHKEGTTPDYLSSLPAGNYQLVLSQAGFPSYTETILIQDGANKILTADLTELSLAANAGANTAKVIRGEMDLAQLNNTERIELARLESQAFSAYLQGNLLACANGELQKLKALGCDTSQLETTLSTQRISAETQVASKLRLLIQKRKLAEACRVFAGIESTFENESIARLNSEFQAPLARYQQQIDTAIAGAKATPSEVGYLQIKTLMRQYPTEIKLPLALVALAQQSPPDHARLVALAETLRTFARANKDDACQPAFVQAQASVNEELQQFDAVAAALTAAKEGTPAQKEELSRLRSHLDTYENRSVGSPDKNNPLSATVNFFGKAMTGHKVVNNHPYFETRQEKREAIEEVEGQIDTLKASMVQSPEVIEQAQKTYDAFVARVPWSE